MGGPGLLRGTPLPPNRLHPKSVIKGSNSHRSDEKERGDFPSLTS